MTPAEASADGGTGTRLRREQEPFCETGNTCNIGDLTPVAAESTIATDEFRRIQRHLREAIAQIQGAGRAT